MFDFQLSLIEEQFDIPVGFQGDHLTPITAITLDFKQTSQSLLQSYVQSESHVLVQVSIGNVDYRSFLCRVHRFFFLLLDDP